MSAPEVRRIVTHHDSEGTATIWKDAPATNRRSSDGHATSTLIWATRETPAPFLVDADAGELTLGTPPPPDGTRFGVIDIPPGHPVHPQHRTDTVDYVVCVWGEIDMEIDDSVVHMKAGDVMVQLGTDHTWINRSDGPARLAFVLIDGYPRRADSVAAGATQNLSSG